MPWRAARTPGTAYVKGLHLLREDPAFLRFNLARALLLSSALALPYIALLAQQRSGSNLGDLGLLIIVSGLAGMLASPMWGKRADASSRRVMRDAGLAAAVCCALAALAGGLPGAWTTTPGPMPCSMAAGDRPCRGAARDARPT